MMRVIKHSESLNVENCDIDCKRPLRHSTLLPSNVRCLITGPSGCGKTNVVIALIEHSNGLRFENINVYSKSLYQPKYEYLEQLLKPIDGVKYNAYSSSEKIVHPSNAKCNTIFIFDDVACDNQNVIRQYFSMGRHKLIDCLYLCQTYSRIPKILIRDNANLIILFKQDEMNLKHVYNDHIGSDMNYNQFRDICSFCWRDKYGFILINKECEFNNGRYRKGFDNFLILDK